jgi:hypothetical protein
MYESMALDGISSDTLNNDEKMITAAVVGKIPDVGPVLSLAVNIFWPTDTPSIWGQIKDKVQNLISQDIAQNNYTQMQTQLTGLNNAVSGYLELTSVSEQQTSIETLATLFADARPLFMAGDPANNFSLAWSMALLHLSVLRWRVTAWAQSTPPNTVPATDLQNAAISYALYGRVALSRIYNNRMSQLQVTQASNNEPGKASQWRCNFSIWDAQSNAYLINLGKHFNSWTPAKVDAYMNKAHAKLEDAWNGVANATQTTLDNLAFTHIQTLEAQWSYTDATALGLLQTGLFSLPDFTTFQNQYYPTQSIYLTPDVTPQSSTPQLPPVPPSPPS